MTDHHRSVAEACLAGAESDTMSFPSIIAALMEAGFEGYAIDYRCARATYYMPDGQSIALAAHPVATPVAPRLDIDALRTAIGEAQRQVAGYTYRGFCEKAVAAGCAGYLVSFTGRRALYVGRDAATHVEHFPATP